MIRRGFLLAAALSCAAPLCGQEKKEPAAPVVRLAPQSAKKPATPMAYRLLPDPLDQVGGNAAPFWNRAMLAARAVKPRPGENDRWASTPLEKLPPKEPQEVLGRYAAALRLADQAALRTRCDWGYPAPTLQTLKDLPLEDIAGQRVVAAVISLRYRVALRERKFGVALHSLQTGFALARDLGQSDLMIQNLVAVAIAHIMLHHVEEWVQTPGSPNLYWALTALPRPLVDVRKSIRVELNTIYRSFPVLRELKREKMAAGEVSRVVGKLSDAFPPIEGVKLPAWAKKEGVAALVQKHYPAAKRALLASGRSPQEVAALPAVQVVVVNYLDQYDRARDEILRWLALPMWQGRKGLQKVEADARRGTPDQGEFLVRMLMPAVVKVYDAQLRLGRTTAGLRGAELLRLSVATTGRPPATWEDAAGAYLGPTDPFTGQGLAAWYRPDGRRGVLDVPPPPGMPVALGRRYETAGKGEKK
jgi:hypothetical protein